MPALDTPIYLVTDRHQTGGRPLIEAVVQALAAGVGAVQLREPDLGTRPLLDLAGELRTLTAQHKAKLLINDRLDIALAVEADGVHLRANSLPVSAARRLLGSERLIGVSTHSVEDVVRAEESGADFVVLGPVYETPSKRAYGKPLGPDAIARAASRSRIPILAIGGVVAPRSLELRRAGASGMAVVSAILSSSMIGDATALLLEAWRRADSKAVPVR
jgi:thiamine-phosphate pyrophosphorylase